MSQVPFKSLAVVPYLDTGVIGGRRVNLMPMWDGERWHWWVELPNGELMTMHPVETMQVDYVAKAPARPSDLLVPFVELMWQQLSYEDIWPLTSAICDAFHKLGTSVAKLQHMFRARNTIGPAVSDFATTEVEYVGILARTIYDLLQEAIARIWQNHVRLHDPVAERRRKASALPATFSKMVLADKKVRRTAEEIVAKFGVPENVATVYAELAPDFIALRDMRDRLVHSGVGVQRVFSTERGFCVSPSDPAFRGCDWTEKHRYNQNLVSVLPWIAKVVLTTIGACHTLLRSVASNLTLLPPLAPGYRVFVRGPSTDALLNVLAIFQGASPWWSDSDADAGELEHRIRERAYHLWKQRAPGTGDSLRDWLNAEAIERGLAPVSRPWDS